MVKFCMKNTVKLRINEIKNGRELAVLALFDCFENNNKLNLDILANGAVDRDLAFLEIKRALALAYGCVEDQYTIDYELNLVLQKPLDKLDPLLRTVLRLAAYELKAAREPAYAIINESCNIFKKIAKDNFHLQISKSLRNKEMIKPLVSFLNACLRAYHRRLPFVHKTKDLSLNFAMKNELIGYFKLAFGADQYIKELEAIKNFPKYLFGMCNLLKIDFISLKAKMAEEGVEIHSLEDFIDEKMLPNDLKKAYSLIKNNAFYIETKGINFKKLTSFREGLFWIQGLCSMLVSSLTAFYTKGEISNIFDVCAAPGGKSIMPRVLNDNKSYFYMSDISAARLEKTNENIIRLGLDGDDLIKLYVADAREKYPSDFLGKMDIVICDVPCSGLGTIKSKPDIKYHLNHQKIMDLLPLQAEILNNASSLLKKKLAG